MKLLQEITAILSIVFAFAFAIFVFVYLFGLLR